MVPKGTLGERERKRINNEFRTSGGAQRKAVPRKLLSLDSEQ